VVGSPGEDVCRCSWSVSFRREQLEAGAEAEDAVVADVDVKERRLFDAVHVLLQQQAERTERGSNEELVRVCVPRLWQPNRTDGITRASGRWSCCC